MTISERHSVNINDHTVELTDVVIGHLNALLVASSREWAAKVASVGKKTMDFHMDFPNGDDSTLSKFGFKNLQALRTALMLENNAYRKEVEEYGSTICTLDKVKFTDGQLKVIPWLFTSLNPAEIASRVLGGKSKRTADDYIYKISLKVLQDGYEQNRYNVCAALLALGYPTELPKSEISLSDFEAQLTRGQF